MVFSFTNCLYDGRCGGGFIIMNYILSGWIETEFKLEEFHIEGLDLEACVAQLAHDYDELGDVDMELNGGYGTPD